MSNLAILGGSKIRNTPFKNRISMGVDEKNAAIKVLDSDILSGFVGAAGKFFDGGKEVKNFEKIWAEAYNFKHAISTNSWTTGLQTAVGAIGIEPGDEVICSPFTMSASATCVLFYGGIPIFADIDPIRFTLNPQSVESLITPRTKAIIVVHLFGYPADMDSLVNIARKFNLKIIEDCAQAPGVYYKNKPVGTIGDIGGFSLNFHKHIQSGEGGLLVTNDDNLALKCRLIRNHGENAIEGYNVTDLSNTIGSNYRITEIQAAIAAVQFTKLKNFLGHRKLLADCLSNELSGINGIGIPQIEKGTTHSYYMYPILFNEDVFSISRNLFLKAVSAELPDPNYWDTTPLAEGYVKPLYLNPIYQNQIAIGKKGFPFTVNKNIKYNYSKGICPVTEKIHEKEILITPLIREGIEISDIKDFSNAIHKVIENIDELRKVKGKFNNEIFDAVNAIDKNVKS